MRLKMPQHFLTLLFVSCLNGCSTNTVKAFDPSSATLVSTGSFTATNSHVVKGQLKFYKNGVSNVLALSDFKTEAGQPHTHILFSETLSGSNALDAGAIKTFEGDHYYNVSTQFETDTRRIVLLWNYDFSSTPVYAYALMNKI
jgi:hypothetical protein